MPPRIPHVTPEMARSARDHFQHLYKKPLSDEDGREIAVNLLGFFETLIEMRARRQAEQEAGASQPPTPSVTPPRVRKARKTRES